MHSMDYPQLLLQTLEALYRLGKRVCAEVEGFQPDLVLGLAHSGWMPVIVAQALWSAAHTAAFPPVLRTNIGQEKHAIYAERYKPPMPAYCCGECCGNSTDRLGHYLAWIADQQPWLDSLRAQVQRVYRGDLARILVVDDLFSGYCTCYTALGLLDILYPQSDVRMVAGGKDLTNDYVDAWLLQYAPSLVEEITQSTARNDRARYPGSWHKQLKPLITGSEDITPGSLDWQPLHPASPAVQKLSGIVPLETVLEAPSWAASLACKYALNRQREKVSIPETPEDDNDYTSRRAPRKLKPAERLFRQAWLNNGITHQEIARLYTNLHGGQAEGLKQVKEFAQLHGHGRAAAYMPEEATESWVTAYDPPDELATEHHGFFIRGFGEFMPGQLWAGAYPHYEYSPQPALCLRQVEMCKDLLASGVRCFIDLTTPDEFHARWPYHEALAQAGLELSLEADRISFPLGFRTVPARSQISTLFHTIQATLGAGRGIYLHAGHNLEGRTPLVLACLLVDQGLAPQQALSRVAEFWLQVLPYLIRLPLTEAQRGFVLRWKKS